MAKGTTTTHETSEAIDHAPLTLTAEPTREACHYVAAAVGCDVRLARKILIRGPRAARNVVQREKAIALFASVDASGENA